MAIALDADDDGSLFMGLFCCGFDRVGGGGFAEEDKPLLGQANGLNTDHVWACINKAIWVFFI